MSPLIDCVFLLLIFFLATRMLKKWEKQIPIQLPESEIQIGAEADLPMTTIGVDSEGRVYEGQRGSSESMLTYTPMGDLATHLQRLAAEVGPSTPIQFAVQKGTDTQTVITLLDVCQVQGFENVSVRIRNQPLHL